MYRSITTLNLFLSLNIKFIQISVHLKLYGILISPKASLVLKKSSNSRLDFSQKTSIRLFSNYKT